MAIKLTKRKGFNFFRSYYDVYNELETDSDKVAFIDALLDRQFLGIKPTNLKGMAKFAYISQTNSIDSQVKGYEDKTGIILDPTQGGSVGCIVTPTEQEKEKEKEKVQEQVDFDLFLNGFNVYAKKNIRILEDKAKKQLLALVKKGYTRQDVINAITNCANDKYHIENPKYLTPEFITREDKFVKYLNSTTQIQELPKNWWNMDLTPEQWKLVPKEKVAEKENQDIRRKMGI
jgi:uncharacterized phage protein (TIGR02220 family)